MPFLPDLPDNAKVPHVLGQYRSGAKALVELHQAILREESPIEVRDREMIAAYVSSLNACDYCIGAHTNTAMLFGVPEGLVEDLVADIDKAAVDDKLKPILKFVKKLTETPTRMTQADADAVYEAGWDAKALYNAIQICCLYNFMNRFTFGAGLAAIEEEFAEEADMLHKGYTPLIEKLGL